MQLLVGSDDLTNLVTGLSFSNTDPGGYEACSFSINSDYAIKAGKRVTVLDGGSIVWFGRVSEVTRNVKFGISTTQVGCEGYMAALKDTAYQMIYVDRDLSHWKSASVQRRINWVSTSDTEDGQIIPDSTTGTPSLQEQISGPTTRQRVCEMWYDARGLIIGSLYYAWKISPQINSADASWLWQGDLSTDDLTTSVDTTGNLRSAGPGSGTLLSVGNDKKFAKVALIYATTLAADQIWQMWWTVLAVYGVHGVPKRGVASTSSPQGFYPSDIARHALLQTQGILPGVIVDSTGYITTQSVYFNPTAPATVIDDQSKLLGWHWGVWGPATMLDYSPTFDFRPPPSDATASVARAACEDLSLGGRLDSMYDVAKVNYSDAAGSVFTQTVTLANLPLQEAGVSRTLAIDMGLGSAAAAQTYGAMLLQLSQSSQRATGSATLPSVLADGRPSHFLRSGIDRLRITDLPDVGPITDTDTRRRDTFRISRVETSVDDTGVPKTKVDLDNGSNLLEVLQARLALATSLVG